MRRLSNFLRGVASIFDIWPASQQINTEIINPCDNRTDAEALAGDWRRVGDHLREAMDVVMDLPELKKRLSKRFVGHDGVHGIGLRLSEDAICVYLTSGFNGDQQAILTAIEVAAKPHKVIRIVEEPPNST